MVSFTSNLYIYVTQIALNKLHRMRLSTESDILTLFSLTETEKVLKYITALQSKCFLYVYILSRVCVQVCGLHVRAYVCAFVRV